MPQITVGIAGKSYRMACGEGEEAHLEGLAGAFDAKIAEMRAAFGEIGDMRLHVMAALTLADELAEARSRLAALEAEVSALRAAAAEGARRAEAVEAEGAETLTRAAARIERLAKTLGGQAQPQA
jgi:cell division protein ZapA